MSKNIRTNILHIRLANFAYAQRESLIKDTYRKSEPLGKSTVKPLSPVFVADKYILHMSISFVTPVVWSE